MSYPLEDGQHVLPANPPQPFSLGLCLQVTPPRHLPGPVLSPHTVPCCRFLHRATTVGHLSGGCWPDDCSMNALHLAGIKNTLWKLGFNGMQSGGILPHTRVERLREGAQMCPEDAGKREGRAQTRVASPLNGQGPLICAPFTLNSSQGRSNWNIREHASLEWKFGGAEAFARCILLLGTLFSTAQ